MRKLADEFLAIVGGGVGMDGDRGEGKACGGMVGKGLSERG